MFDLVIRRGFPGGARVDHAALLRPLGLESVLETTIANERDPRPGVLEFIGAGDAPFVWFVDESFAVSPALAQKMLRLLASGKAKGLTVVSPVARQVLGLAEIGHGDLVSASVTALPLAAPWCCILPREAIVNDEDWTRFRSYTFALLALSQRIPMLAGVGHDGEDLALAPWLTTLLSHEAMAISADLADDVFATVDVPPQFQIETRGEYFHPVSSTTNNLPRISVITPAYKSRFLEEAIASVLEQTYENWEYVILVDGPPADELDEIRDILAPYEHDERFQIHYQENMGTGPTRARLATLARGEYVLSLDDDDKLPPYSLDRIAMSISMTRADIVRGGMQVAGYIEHYISPRPRAVINGIPIDIFEGNQPWAIRRSLLEKLGGFEGDPNLRGAGEDSDFFMKTDVAEAAVALIDEPLYIRRLSPYNQTLSTVPEEFHAHIRRLFMRHSPSGWDLKHTDFIEDGHYIRQISTLRHANGGTTIVAPTRYFNFSQKGEAKEVFIDLEVTAQCNADCTFCPRENLGRVNKFLPMQVVDILAEQVRAEKGGRKIVLCGIGEPTLHPEVEEIVARLKRVGAIVGMTNNGSRMTVDRFERLINAGITEMNFSVNAATAETRQKVMRQKNYDLVVRNIKNVLEFRDKNCPGIHIHVSFVLCPQNQHEVHDFVAQWRDTSVSRIWIHPVNNRANLLTEEYGHIDAAAVYRRYHADPRVDVDLWDDGYTPEYRDACWVPQRSIAITSDGDMLLCVLDHERKNIIGNLGQGGLLQLHLEKIAKYRRGQFDSFCKGCDYCPSIVREGRRMAVLS